MDIKYFHFKYSLFYKFGFELIKTKYFKEITVALYFGRHYFRWIISWEVEVENCQK